MPNKQEYLDEVCKQIRFRAARKYLRQELAAHIEDKKEEYLKTAAPDAEEKAVASMGDAAETGRALNAVHRPRTEWGVIACVLFLSIIGSVIISVTSANDTAFISGWSLRGQLMTSVLGFGVMVAACFFNYDILFRLRFVIYAVALVLCGLEALFTDVIPQLRDLITEFNFIFALTPLFFLLSIFCFIEANRSHGMKGFLRTIIYCSIFILAARTFGSFDTFFLAAVYLIVISVMTFRSYRKNAWPRILIAAGMLAVTLIIARFLQEYIYNLMYGQIFHINITWGLGVDLTPDENTLMVRKMLTGAQLIGPSPYYLQRQSWDLQGSGSSFILTSVIAAYGWLPAIGILLVFALLLTLMLIRSSRINHTFGRLLSTGVCILFLVRLADCLLMNTGLIGGLPGALPFISKGNTDYIINSLLIGLFLSVWRRSSFMKDSRLHFNPAEEKEGVAAGLSHNPS